MYNLAYKTLQQCQKVLSELSYLINFCGRRLLEVTAECGSKSYIGLLEIHKNFSRAIFQH